MAKQIYCGRNGNGNNHKSYYLDFVMNASSGAIVWHTLSDGSLTETLLNQEVLNISGLTEDDAEMANANVGFFEDESFIANCINPDCIEPFFKPNPEFTGYVLLKSLLKYRPYAEIAKTYIDKLLKNPYDKIVNRGFRDEIINGKWCCSKACADIMNSRRLSINGMPVDIIPKTGIFTDRRGGTHYKTTQIGKQIWMAQNLNATRFQNGDTIFEARTQEEWSKYISEKKPAWCYAFKDTLRRPELGKLYNWYAINDSRQLAPEGWHLPTQQEWEVLLEELGGTEKAGKKLKSKYGWLKDSYGMSGNGDNTAAFNALPTSILLDIDTPGNLYYGYGCGWWSSTVVSKENLESIIIQIQSGSKVRVDINDIRHGGVRPEGFSVRCLKN